MKMPSKQKPSAKDKKINVPNVTIVQSEPKRLKNAKNEYL